MAEVQGFEPWEPCGSLVFKTNAIDHSATLPNLVSIKESNLTAVDDMTPVMSVTVSEPALTNYLSSFGSCLGHPGHHLFNCFTRGTKLFIWYEQEDLNLHALLHRHLKPTCLPIPPCSLKNGAPREIRTPV